MDDLSAEELAWVEDLQSTKAVLFRTDSGLVIIPAMARKDQEGYVALTECGAGSTVLGAFAEAVLLREMSIRDVAEALVERREVPWFPSPAYAEQERARQAKPWMYEVVRVQSGWTILSKDAYDSDPAFREANSKFRAAEAALGVGKITIPGIVHREQE